MVNWDNASGKVALDKCIMMQGTPKAPQTQFAAENETEATNTFAASSGHKSPSSQDTESNKPAKEVPLYMGQV